MKNVVLIPREAVFVAGDGPIAYRRGLFSVSPVPIHLGRQSEKLVEVTSGLAPTDRVLVEKPDEKSGENRS